MKLTDILDDTIKIDGKTYKIDMSFDNILRIYELKDDEEFSEARKIELMFEMLLIDCEDLLDISIHKKSKIVDFILNNYLKEENETQKSIGNENGNSKVDMSNSEEEKPKKVYDFVVDAERIYASFLKEYGIDLIEEQGKLHWKKFMALLSNLSPESPFMFVVNIRTKPLPTGKYATEERKRLVKLKRKYSLEEPTQKGREAKKALDAAASYLFAMAAKKERGGNKQQR